jgi:hypothetical protein
VGSGEAEELHRAKAIQDTKDPGMNIVNEFLLSTIKHLTWAVRIDATSWFTGFATQQ